MGIEKYIRSIPDWPKPGIIFRDITTLLAHPVGFARATNALTMHYKEIPFDKIVAIESRGFVFGAVLAKELNKGMVIVRKPGKLPGETVSEEYQLEYGTDKIEIQKDALKPGEKVVVIDDLLATGGTAMAAINLVEKMGAKVVEAGFIIDLPDVGGSKKLTEAGYGVFSLVAFEGD